MAEYDEIMSGRAIVARRQIHSDCGGATVFCVVLADGFIVECGSDGSSQRRAELLAKVINSGDYGAFRFSTSHHIDTTPT